MDENHLTPEEVQFFNTGELQPGMVPETTPETPTPEAQAAQPPATPPVVQPDLHQQQVSTEIAEVLRRSLQEAQQRAANLEATVAQLQQQVTAPKLPEPEPDINTDPLGAMMHKLEMVNKTVADLQAQLGQQQSQQQQLTAFQQFKAQVEDLREQFVKVQPDFPDAYNHVRNARIADLRMFGLPEDRIQQVLFQEEAAVAQKAISLAQNPAAAIYEMAKRHGYVPKTTPTPGVPTTPDNKLASIQQAQAASRNLPSTPNLEDFTVEGLKGASDADLTKLVNDEKMWAKIVGADQYPI